MSKLLRQVEESFLTDIPIVFDQRNDDDFLTDLPDEIVLDSFDDLDLIDEEDE